LGLGREEPGGSAAQGESDHGYADQQQWTFLPLGRGSFGTGIARFGHSNSYVEFALERSLQAYIGRLWPNVSGLPTGFARNAQTLGKTTASGRKLEYAGGGKHAFSRTRFAAVTRPAGRSRAGLSEQIDQTELV
jgi:hypothetical protein